MSNDTWVNQFKQGKLNIDNTNLNNEDKIRLARMENLIKDLIGFYERVRKLTVQFDESHFTEETNPNIKP